MRQTSKIEYNVEISNGLIICEECCTIQKPAKKCEDVCQYCYNRGIEEYTNQGL